MLLLMKKKKEKITQEKESEYGELFGSDENFAFIAGFTSGGVPYGITHEEMRIIELEEKQTNKKETSEY